MKKFIWMVGLVLVALGSGAQAAGRVYALTVTDCNVSGTVDETAVGDMRWENTAASDSGSFSAQTPWSFNTDLAVGSNEILVYATNSIGNEGSESITVIRVGAPSVTITNPIANTNVYGEVAAFTVSGTNNEWVAGTMVWTNAANAVSGTFSAPGGPAYGWQVSSIPLAFGENLITVDGTNLAGEVAQDNVVVMRRVEHGGVSPVHYVSTNGAAVYPYTNWTDAATSIQDAVDAAAWDDMVLVTNGVYALSSEITINKKIIVQSMNGADVTIVNGQGACRGFNLDSYCTIRGFTVTNGCAINYVIYAGGGVFCASGDVVIENCVVSGNVAKYGGGIHGGGDAYNCVISGNTATQNGGGVNTIAMHNSLVIGNHAGFRGGGAYCADTYNCTVVNNTSVDDGGGVVDRGHWNSIIWGNTASNDYNNAYSGGYRYCCLQGSYGSNFGGNITDNPLMNADYTLQLDSPCINSGCNEYEHMPEFDLYNETDLAGYPRISGRIADMGAYETQYHVVYVDASRPDDSAVGVTWETAKKTIQAAVDYVDVNGTVLITNGTYAITSHVAVAEAILIESVNGHDVTIVDGQDTCRGFHLGNSACTLSGLTVTNGYAVGGAGGGVYCTGLTPVITNCIVSGNHADFDAGGVNRGTIIDCVLSGNRAGDDGGGCSYSDVNDSILSDNTADNNGGGSYYGTLSNCTLNANTAVNNGGGSFHGALTNCTLTANTSGDKGGGAYQGVLENCLFTGNVAPNYGGGACDATLSSCTLDGNDSGNNGGGASGCVLVRCILENNTTAQKGGGAYLGVLENCLLTGNVATNYGGGACDAALSSCTLNDNTSAYRGGGVSGGMQENCVVWGNTAADTGNDIYSGTNRYTCASDGITHGADGCVTNDPLFVLAGDRTLSPDSPCINIGDSAAAPAGTDLAGTRRISGSAIDMGAYEFFYTAVYVDDARPDDTGNGFSWAAAKKTIQAGVDMSDSIVWVTNGTYALTSEIVVDRAMTVQSVNGPDLTTVDGQGSVRCFNLEDIACTISGFTMTNGHASSNGGGVSCRGYTQIITNCILTGNSAVSYGGGVAQGTLNNCELRGNSAEYGGGAYRATLNGCIITGNTATQYGGGSYGSKYQGELNHCIISGNSATYGGGTCRRILKNCLLINNTASEEGGGACSGYLYNCTFSGNTAGTSGGGVSQFYYPLEMYNCVVWGNTAGDQGNDIYFLGSMPTITHTCASDGITNGISACITSAPLFIAASSSNYHLSYGSPCIDTGTNLGGIVDDLDNTSRPLDGNWDGTNTTDMGCYEYNPATADSNGDGIPDGWYHGYELNPTNPLMATIDSDTDGPDNKDEYIADTNPQNSNSNFRISAISANSLMTVYFDSSPNRLYTLNGCTNLVEGAWQPLLGPRLGVGGDDSMMDDGSSPAKFYQLRVELP